MRFVAPLSLLVVAVACNNKTPEPEPLAPAKPASTSSPSPPPTSSSSAKPGKPADVAWDAPDSFEKSDKSSPMRKATYKIKRAPGDDEDAELSVTQVGGTLEQNIKRWSEQFEDKTEGKRSERTVGEIKVTIVEMQGTYSGMAMPGQPPSQPKKNWALLGAIIDTQTPTFFKMTGPSRTVNAARKDFDKMVDSIHPK